MESDPRHNPFAEDIGVTLTALHGAGVRLAVLSDIHFDLRPVFDDAGLAGVIDVFVLSFEQGRQKPIPPCSSTPWPHYGRRPTRR